MRSGGLWGRWLAALSPSRLRVDTSPWGEAMAEATLGIALARDGVVLCVNHAFVSLCGRSQASLVGAPWSEAIRVADASQGHPWTREVPMSAERTLVGDDGVSRRVLAISSRFGEGARGTALFLVSLEAITVDAPRKGHPLGEILSRDEGVVSLVAHEFRSPLVAIRSALTEVREWTLSMEMDTSARRSIVALVEGADRRVAALSRLASNVLDAGRLHYEGVEPERERFDLRELVAEAIRDFADEAGEAQVSVRLDEGDPVIGAWDRVQMGQVVGNLLSNAIKYGGSVAQVSVSIEGGLAVVRVRDDGPGIAEAHHARIFDRFERLAADGRSRRGVGLGLWVVRRIVDLHGGSVSVRSAPGAGAEFSVTLPVG